MTPRERVLTALKGGQPDRVPWVEGGFEETIKLQVMGGRTDFTPGELCRRLGMDGFGFHFPIGARPSDLVGKEAWYHPTSVTFDFAPPWIAELGTDARTGRTYVKRGLLTSRDALDLFDEYLPDPDHPARYEQVAEWLEKYREDYAVYARLRLGTASTLESMGLDVFSIMMYDDPDLVKEVHRRFSEWSARVVAHLNRMDFDFYWVADDQADNKAPWVSPEMWEEFLAPYQRMVAGEFRKPWIFHSDGNLFPLLDGLLTLGMNAVHPLQPSAMDINRMKQEYGDRVCIVGNIDLDYTLPNGTVEEVDAEVRKRIAEIGKGGGYIISTSNSITDYCKVENILAMAEAIRKYAAYP